MLGARIPRGWGGVGLSLREEVVVAAGIGTRARLWDERQEGVSVLGMSGKESRGT